MLPNFLIIGAYKAGTTALHRMLRQHPDVFMPWKKEPNFFAFVDGGKETVPTAKDVTDIASYSALFKNAGSARAVGEASPLYLSSARAAGQIHRHTPHAKLIAVLRHPSEAVFSNYLMNIRERREHRPFRQVVDDIISFLKQDPLDGPFYGAQLQRYLEYFPHEQLSVHLYEDLQKDPHALVAKIFDFLGVDSAFKPDISNANAARISKYHWLEVLYSQRPVRRLIPKDVLGWLRNQNTSSLPLPRLQDDERRRLDDIFNADVMALEKILGIDLRHWRGE